MDLSITTLVYLDLLKVNINLEKCHQKQIPNHFMYVTVESNLLPYHNHNIYQLLYIIIFYPKYTYYCDNTIRGKVVDNKIQSSLQTQSYWSTISLTIKHLFREMEW